MLELFHWEPNGSWLKPLIVLREKGIECRYRYVDVLAMEGHQPGFMPASRETQLNPEGEGPILVHDGRQVTESLFVMEYLEDAFPENALRPADALGRARILAWARFINEVLMPAASTLGCHKYLAPRFQGRDTSALEGLLERIPMTYLREGWRAALKGEYSPELLDDSRRKVGVAARRIEDALAASSSGWLVGADYSLADIDAFAICNALPTLTDDIVNESATPRLMDWLAQIRARPAVRAALSMGRMERPEEAFAPGPEHSRWG